MPYNQLPILSRVVVVLIVIWSGSRGIAQVDPHNPAQNPGIELAKANLTARVEQIELANDLAQFTSIEAWESQRELLREQLREMLGLPPLESRSMELHAVTTGTKEVDDVVVEKLHFQSSPGVYVTGNLSAQKLLKIHYLPFYMYADMVKSKRMDSVLVTKRTINTIPLGSLAMAISPWRSIPSS